MLHRHWRQAEPGDPVYPLFCYAPTGMPPPTLLLDIFAFFTVPAAGDDVIFPFASSVGSALDLAFYTFPCPAFSTASAEITMRLTFSFGAICLAPTLCSKIIITGTLLAASPVTSPGLTRAGVTSGGLLSF